MNKKSFNLDTETQDKLNSIQSILVEVEDGELLTESAIIRRAIRYYYKHILEHRNKK